VLHYEHSFLSKTTPTSISQPGEAKTRNYVSRWLKRGLTAWCRTTFVCSNPQHTFFSEYFRSKSGYGFVIRAVIRLFVEGTVFENRWRIERIKLLETYSRSGGWEGVELWLTCCCGDVGRPLALPLETTVADSVAVGTGDAPSFCYVNGDGNRSYTGVSAVVLVELLLLLCSVFNIDATENVARPLLRKWRRYWAPRSDIQTSVLQP